MTTPTRMDQKFLDQPTFFDGPGRATDANLVDHGKRSRDEQYQRIVNDLSDRERIWYSRILIEGSNGITADELAVKYNVPQNVFSGRITALKAINLVRHTKERRPTSLGGTASVIVASKFLENDQPDLLLEVATTSTVDSSCGECPDLPEDKIMPGQLVRDVPPADQHGNLMAAGNRYVIDKRLHFCFEGDDGDLLVQRCTNNGQAISGTRPQSVFEMRGGSYTVHLMGS